MTILVKNKETLFFDIFNFKCCVRKNGISSNKFEGDNKVIKEVEKKISIDNNIIRFLTVKYKKLDLENQYIGENKKTNEKK